MTYQNVTEPEATEISYITRVQDKILDWWQN